MSDNPHHEHLMQEITEMFYPLFTHSPQGIYIYLDDTHKTCNEKFSGMLGYVSTQEWVDNEEPISDVVEEDQDEVIQAYKEASEELSATNLQATWIKKDGTKILTDIIMVPVTYRDEVFIVHFITLLHN